MEENNVSKNQGSNKRLIILLIILVVLVAGLLVYKYVFMNRGNNNNEPNNNQTIVEETLIKEVKNEEVKSLLSYVESSIKSNNVCLGDYYLKQYSQHTLNDKIALVLLNYAKEETLTSDQEKTASSYGVPQGSKYVTLETVKEGLKKLYNIDLNESEIKDGSDYGKSVYVNKIGFIKLGGGGDYPAVQKQAVIGYEETTNAITVTVVQAELGLDGNVYRYANKPETLVLSNATTSFEFTKENVKLFPQVKYTFTKNESGNYYLNNVENLNFTEDFVDCK